jgi:tetratricopeptide (TPR) repeat protein
MEALVPVQPTAVAAAAAVTMIAVPLLVKATDGIKYQWNKYGKLQIKEIKEIRLIYKELCWPLEKDHTLTTLDVNDAQKKVERKEVSEFPIYLRTKNNDELPELFEQGFCPVKDSEHWRKHIIKTSPLKHPIEEIVSYICHYQLTRDERFISAGYNYDPTNMFFEEFKAWLLKLSAHKELDSKILEIAVGRYKYLGEIYAKGVFSPSNSEYTRVEAVKHVMDIFKKVIIPTIKLCISRRSAREHFERLKDQVESNIKLGIKFLFYVFRDTPQTPASFILEQIRNPNLAGYKEVILSTTSGQLLNHLLNTKVMYRVFKYGTDSDLSIANIQSCCSNSFIGEEGSIIYPFTTLTSTAYNWYEFMEEKGNSHNPTGILSIFRNKETMKKFLHLHGLMQKLCVFYIICEKLYELSGDGGNILVYGFALKEVISSLQKYKDLNKEVAEIVNFLYSKAEEYKSSLMRKDNYENVKITTWNALYYRIYKTYEELEEGISESMSLVHEIERKIVEINSKRYQEEVKERLGEFYIVVDYFSEKSKPTLYPRSSSENGFFKKAKNDRLEGEKLSDAPSGTPIIAFPNSSTAKKSNAQLYSDALEAFNNKNYLKSAELFEQLLSGDEEIKKNPTVWLYLGKSKYGAGPLSGYGDDQVIECYEKALKICPPVQQEDYVTILYHLGDIYEKAGLLAQAKINFEKIIETILDANLKEKNEFFKHFYEKVSNKLIEITEKSLRIFVKANS